jgi:hypothetical protein
LREIEFRQWSSGFFHYWGSGPDSFTGPLSNHLDILSEQYTGLRDKNGKKIFEGDVVIFRNTKTPALIVWNPLFASFCLRRSGWVFNHFFGEAVYPFDVEVIGNIHENPELLEVKE